MDGPRGQAAIPLLVFAGLLLAGAGALLFAWWAREVRKVRQDRRRLEEELSSARLRSLERHVHDIELILRTDGSIAEANDRAVEAYGHSRDELRRMNVCALRAPGSGDGCADQLAQVMSAGALRFDGQHRRRDGSTFPVEVSTRLFRAGPETFVHALIRDATEKRAAERALRLATVGTLAGGMAHEINNPLSVILANLDWLRRTQATAPAPDAGEAGQAIREAADAAERVRDIVAALRAFAVGETEVPTWTQLGLAVEESIKVAHGALQACAQVEVDTRGAPEIEVNPQSVVHVLSCILANAGQATADRPNRVRIRAGADDADRAFVEITDTGAGIPPDVLPRIFEPFFSTKAVGKGKGLGLSVSLGIVRALGGDISARSEVGEGTTFRVVLPTRRGPVAAGA